MPFDVLMHLSRAFRREEDQMDHREVPPGELAVEEAMSPLIEHPYTSTYCLHELHDRCRLTCKMCAAPCRCVCHLEPGVLP